MKYKLKHKTLYTYVNAVHNYQSVLCLQPQSSARQICTNFKIEIEPKPSKIYSRKDYFGNIQHYFSLHESHTKLNVIVSSEIEVLKNVVQPWSTISCEETTLKINANPVLKADLLIYQLPSQFINWDDNIIAFAQSCLIPEAPLFECVMNLTKKNIYRF
jgi:transglutaminase-like putative cysteine protease